MVLSMSMQPEQRQHLGLSVEHQERLRRMWDNFVSDPFMGTPKAYRKTVEESRQANKELGEFSAAHLKLSFTGGKGLAKIRRQRRKKVVAVGYGQGPDSKWIAEATEAGYETWWVDISDLSCSLATLDLQEQWKKTSVSSPRPVVQRAEVRSLLINPEVFGLDLDTVEIWYLCRTLGCLSKRGAKIVLQIIGQSLSLEKDEYKEHEVVLIVAAEGGSARTSTAISRGSILSNLRRGAGRQIEVRKEGYHQFYNRDYTAMTIGAK